MTQFRRFKVEEEVQEKDGSLTFKRHRAEELTGREISGPWREIVMYGLPLLIRLVYNLQLVELQISRCNDDDALGTESCVDGHWLVFASVITQLSATSSGSAKALSRMDRIMHN